LEDDWLEDFVQYISLSLFLSLGAFPFLATARAMVVIGSGGSVIGGGGSVA
jgi:hypothetical protein